MVIFSLLPLSHSIYIQFCRINWMQLQYDTVTDKMNLHTKFICSPQRHHIHLRICNLSIENQIKTATANHFVAIIKTKMNQQNTKFIAYQIFLIKTKAFTNKLTFEQFRITTNTKQNQSIFKYISIEYISHIFRNYQYQNRCERKNNNNSYIQQNVYLIFER